MTVEELYAEIGGNYEEAIGRLRSDALVKKFVLRFPDDKSCEQLFSAWKAGDEAAAFEAAHAAKGVCSNLALTGLASLASGITEALRPGNEGLRGQTDVDALVTQLEGAYRKTVETIASFA